MVLFKKTDWKKSDSVLATIPLDPNGGTVKKIPPHILASDGNPRMTVESAKHWRTLDTAAQKRAAKEWNDVGRAQKDKIRANLAGLEQLRQKLLENADDVDWATVSPLIDRLELEVLMAQYNRTGTRSEAAAAAKKRGRAEGTSAATEIHKATIAKTNEKAAAVAAGTHANRSTTTTITPTLEEPTREEAEDGDEENLPPVGFASSEADRTALANEKKRIAKSAPGRTKDQVFAARVGQQVDQEAERTTKLAHKYVAQASDAIHFPSLHPSQPKRALLLIEVCELEMVAAHGGQKKATAYRSDKPCITFTGLSARSDIGWVLEHAIDALEHENPMKNKKCDRIHIGRDPFETATQAFEHAYAIKENIRKQPSKTHLNPDQVIEDRATHIIAKKARARSASND